MNKPDFFEWATNLSGLSTQKVARELRVIFDKGLSVGRRQGEQEWWIEQDAEVSAQANEDTVRACLEGDTNE